MSKMRAVCSVVLALLFLTGIGAQVHAQDSINDQIRRARVLEVIQDTRTETVPGTDVVSHFQELRVEILEGDRKREGVTFINDFIQLKVGDTFYLNSFTDFEGEPLYSVNDLDRRNSLYLLTALFVFVVVIFGGFQGVRALFSLLASFFVILYFMLPQLLNGAPPVITSIIFSLIILAVVMLVTHGFNRKVLAAFLGTAAAITATGLLAMFSISFTKLSGFISEETTYLNLATGGEIDLGGLLLGAIIIGAIGLLDDVAITQAQVVTELKNAAAHLTKRELYSKALRVGREHIAALINTLALAYAGVSLPLLLLFSASDASIPLIINREQFAAEIVRTIVGSIGLILTVPFSTVLSIYFANSAKEHDGHTHIHASKEDAE